MRVRELVDGHRGPGRPLLVEELGVDLVVALVVVHVHQVRGDLDEVGQRAAGGLEDVADVLDDGSGLGADVEVGDAHLVGLGAHEGVVRPSGAGARDVQEVTGAAGVREPAARRRLALYPHRAVLVGRHRENTARTEPSPSMAASNASPGSAGTTGPSAPLSTTSPARSGKSVRPSTPATHTTALKRWPMQAAPPPAETSAPARVIRMPASRRSGPVSGTGVLPSTRAPAEALSAMVSGRVMSQSAMRESAISMAGRTKSTALITSATVNGPPVRSAPMTKAISASTLGCRKRSMGMGSPSRYDISAKSMP